MARKILLADDSVTAQNMGRRILADAGYDVITVNNGSAALKKAAEQKPDLIILDVYMPGYGGLEVCQRLREAAGTSRIPILLTVGKLEPFKPEEAQRVRADAFVIKPFEASELLAALTKLEDKIVPEGMQQKPAKTFKMDSAGSVAYASDDHEQFGDSETGWKDRLSLPTRKSDDAAASEAEQKAAESKRPSKGKKSEGETKAAPAPVPADITPDELAAIAAAAAVVQKGGGETSTVSAASEPAASSQASAPQSEKKTESEAKKDSEPATEVTAAISKLGPDAGTQAAEVKEPIQEMAVVASTVVEASEVYPGPRWVAEEIPVPEHESAGSLAHEMEKIHAAMAAAEGKTGSTYLPPEPLPAPETKVSETTVSEAKNEQGSSESTSVAPEAPAEPEKTPETVAEAAVEAAAPEPAGETPETPAVAASSEDSKAEPVSAVAETAPAKTEETPAPIETTAPVSTNTENSVYAAAASAGSSVTEPKAGGSETSGSDTEERQRASQLAAAWENWQNVRETILGSPIAAQITEAAAESLKETQQAQPAAAHPAEASNIVSASEDTPPPGNPTAIASIVDSVLAELKPKLMEEIAKSLGKEKK